MQDFSTYTLKVMMFTVMMIQLVDFKPMTGEEKGKEKKKSEIL